MNLKKIVRVIIFLYFSLYPILNYAQGAGILKGLVVESFDNELIIGAVVYELSDISHGVTSDFNGNYQLNLSKYTILNLLSFGTQFENKFPESKFQLNFVMYFSYFHSEYKQQQ